MELLKDTITKVLNHAMLVSAGIDYDQALRIAFNDKEYARIKKIITNFNTDNTDEKTNPSL